MANHFTTIGIPLDSQEQFIEYAELAVQGGKAIKVKQGTYTLFEMGQGVELWGQLNQDNELIGINPHFSGNAVSRVRLINKVEDPQDNELDGRLYVEADPVEDGQCSYPFVFDMPDMAACQFSFPEVRNVQIAAFAHELSIYKDDEEYEQSQEDKPGFASEFFIPAGLFSPDGESTVPPQARAIFGGHVLSAGKLQNTYTGGWFWHIKVRTLGGEIDVVADPAMVHKEICIGGVISGGFWMSGRLI